MTRAAHMELSVRLPHPSFCNIYMCGVCILNKSQLQCEINLGIINFVVLIITFYSQKIIFEIIDLHAMKKYYITARALLITKIKYEIEIRVS